MQKNQTDSEVPQDVIAGYRKKLAATNPLVREGNVGMANGRILCLTVVTESAKDSITEICRIEREMCLGWPTHRFEFHAVSTKDFDLEKIEQIKKNMGATNRVYLKEEKTGSK